MPSRPLLSPKMAGLRITLAAPARSATNEVVEAVVAILLHEDESSDLRTLLIHRAERIDDPWSGQIGLPGGRVARSDPSTKDALKREVREEVGLDLDLEGEELGPLSVGSPMRRLELRVQPWVYGLYRQPSLRIGPELQEAFWVSLSELPSLRTTSEVEIRGARRMVDAFLVEGHIVWGFTHRVLSELLSVKGI